VLFDALLAGCSGVRAMPGWAGIAGLGSLVASPVSDFDTEEIPRKFRRSMGRVAALAVAAGVDGVARSGLPETVLRGGRTGVVFGSTTGSGEAEEEFWRAILVGNSTRSLKSTHFFKVMPHTAATNLAFFLGISGESLATSAACASSTVALGLALDRIRCGRADAILAGGADELHVTTAITFDFMSGASRGFNDHPDHTPRPFDRARDGIVVGEGAAVLVLEEREHALARGAPIMGEVLGYGGTSDPVNMASSASEGMEAAMRLALADANLQADAVDYVNAHATGTRVGDAAEAKAIHHVFGEQVPVSSIKGHLGHLMAACGGVEAVVCLEAMRRGVVPPTRNLADPDVVPVHLPREPLAHPLCRVLSENFGFGGVNAAVVLGAP